MVVFFIQSLLLIICAISEKKVSNIPGVLWRGALTGSVIGPLSDMLWGNFLGLWSYTRGYGPFSLILIGILVYGLFATTVLLLRRARFQCFLAWVMMVAVVYETSNYFYPVWEYQLGLPPLWLVLFLAVGYFVTALFIAAVWHFLLGYRFRFISDVADRARSK